jgi:hypothetical protein
VIYGGFNDCHYLTINHTNNWLDFTLAAARHHNSRKFDPIFNTVERTSLGHGASIPFNTL